MKPGDWISVAALIVSVIGFTFTIWQLVRTANAAEATKRAIERTEKRMALNHLLVLLPQFRLIENDLDPAAADRYSQFLDHVSHIRWQNRVAHQSADHTLT
jgi:hypothetical protein